MKTGFLGTQSLFCSDQYISPLFVNSTFHDWTYVHCLPLLVILAKKDYFIMHQKYLKSCKHPFLKGASFGLLTYDIVLLLDPFLKEKIFFLISVAHICSKLSLCLFIALHTCHHAFYDSTLVIVLLSQ